MTDVAMASDGMSDGAPSVLGEARLARGQGVSLWRQIAQRLEQEIAQGERAPGTRLPTEAELAQACGVNRHTVRRAMEALEARGLIRVEQGRGTFVAEDVLDYPLGPRTRFSETIRRQAKEPAGQILRLAEISASVIVAQALGIEAGARVLVAERLATADGRPIALGTHHFPLARFPDVARRLREDPSITRALALSGVPDYRRQFTRITARLPTPEEATLLQQGRTRPVLVTEAVNTDAEGAPVEFILGCYAAARMQFVVES